MPLSRSRDYLSIGEVLESIRADFPDVSISKIRFLESEGLIAPERTASGYRKFYDSDVKKLRYILSLQRDHFLPLKVIREKLAEVDSDGGGYPAPQAPAVSVPTSERSEDAVAPLTGVQMSREELRGSAGLSEDQLRSLEDFGVLPTGVEYFDEDDLVAARAARGLFRYGVEARHLKMYKQFAERESAFFEQIVSPVTHRRDPEAHKEATRSVNDLLGLSRQLREAVLRSRLRGLL